MVYGDFGQVDDVLYVMCAMGTFCGHQLINNIFIQF